MPQACTRRDLGALAAACVLLRLPALLSAAWFDPDEAAIAVQARTLVDGGRLYVDMADRKPPIPPFIYAAWFELSGSTDPRGPRLVASLLLALAAIVLTREVCRTHGRRVALWTGALYVVSCFAFTPHDGAAANYTHFAVPLATLAILACRRGGWHTLLGGVLLGLAILSRQSWIFAVPAGAVSCWMSARTPGALRFLSGLATGIATAGLLAPWSDYWFWNFESSPGFVFASIDIRAALTAGLASVALFVAYHVAVVAGATARLRSTWRTHFDLWVWVATGIAAASAGFRFFGHYWMQIVPPLVLLAGPAVAEAVRPARRLAAATLGATACLVVVSQCIPTTFRERRRPGPLAATIRACSEPSDRVFVWGSYPELLMAVDRPTAGGMVHSDFVTGRSGGREASTDSVTPGAQQLMMRNLTSHPPIVLVDTSGNRALGYAAFPMSSNDDLAMFVEDRGYTPVSADDGFTLWWAAGSPCAENPAASAP
ncbi:MAG: hypothetical protein Q7V57_01875 [Actinomycetota bacterium]|nr:hypothetical protein [Actinomycetota bacterium]